MHLIIRWFRNSYYCWDFTGHVGEESGTLDTYHSSKGHGTRNPEGLRLLDLCSETDLAISNTFYDRNQDKLVTFSAANNNSQIDYILVKKSFLKHVREVKVIRIEECVTKRKLLVADITVDGRAPKRRIVPSRRKVWKFGNPTVRKDSETFVNEKCIERFSNEQFMGVNNAWMSFKWCRPILWLDSRW